MTEARREQNRLNSAAYRQRLKEGDSQAAKAMYKADYTRRNRKKRLTELKVLALQKQLRSSRVERQKAQAEHQRLERALE